MKEVTRAELREKVLHCLTGDGSVVIFDKGSNTKHAIHSAKDFDDFKTKKGDVVDVTLDGKLYGEVKILCNENSAEEHKHADNKKEQTIKGDGHNNFSQFKK